MADSKDPGKVWRWLMRRVAWFERRVYYRAGAENRPVFFDVQKTAPELDRLLTRNYPIIRREVEALLASRATLPSYHELDPRQVGISNADPKKWKVFMLFAMGEKPEANRARCPETAALLAKVPNLFQAFFSILEGGKSVPAHCGPNYAQIRYHLGLIVPKDNPPSIRVKDQVYTWKEGEAVIFDDTWNHEVYNNSTGDRVILLVDILRPLPLRLHIINQLYSFGIVRLAYAQKVVAMVERFQG